MAMNKLFSTKLSDINISGPKWSHRKFRYITIGLKVTINMFKYPYTHEQYRSGVYDL